MLFSQVNGFDGQDLVDFGLLDLNRLEDR